MSDTSRYAVRYAPGVEDQLAEIYDYVVAQGAPRAAFDLRERLLTAINSLDRLPERGRPIGRSLRELTVVWPYVIRYRVTGAVVIITRVRHSARRSS